MGKITITTGITGDSLVSSLNNMNDELYGGLIVQTEGGGHYAIPESGATPVGLGVGALDLQATRGYEYQTAKSTGSFIAGGRSNEISDILARDSKSYYSHVENLSNRAHDWYGHAEGTGCIVDGKISHVEGNTSICSANDSHAEGNRTSCGRVYFPNITYGSEDAGDGLGVLQFALIPIVEGDVSAHFPNALIDSAYILLHYGVGAQKDVKGNIYASEHTPAVWTGEIPTAVNDLKWALHRICILRGSNEPDIAFATIAKTVYSAGVGTKVYYFGSKPYSTLIGIYSSYAPTVSVDGIQAGNGGHTEGIFSSTYGYAAHAEGYFSRAKNYASHAEGYFCKSLGYSSHAEGNLTTASGAYSHSEGLNTVASGQSSHTEGNGCIASGQSAHSEGILTKATAICAHAQNRETEANGENSNSSGLESVAKRKNEIAYSAGKRVTKGDDQTITINYSFACAGVGWFEIYILNEVEDGKVYNFDTMVLGTQYAGTAGVIGDSFAYRFTGMFIRNGETYTTIGTPTRTLIGRSAGMTGDGLTTGARMSYYGRLAGQHRVDLRFDGVTDTTFRVQAHSTIQELKYN